MKKITTTAALVAAILLVLTAAQPKAAGNIPATGDNSQIYIWAVIAVVALAAVIVLAIPGKGKKKRK